MPRKQKAQPGRRAVAPPEAAYQGRTRYPVSPEDFALTWNTCASSEEVAEKLGMPEPIVLARVSNYRKKGVNLKKMRRKNSRRLDVGALNKIIKGENTSFCDGIGGRLTPELTQLVLVVFGDGVKMPPRRGFTIRMYLPDGSPDGIRIVEKSNWTGRMVVCPRSRFGAAKSLPVFSGPGAYILLGPPGEDGRPLAYLGEGDPVLARLENHYFRKPFWDSLLLFSCKDGSLNKVHVQHVEARLAELAREAGRCVLENRNCPQLPTLCEAGTAEVEGYLDELLLVCPLVGLNIFERAPHNQMESSGPAPPKSRAGDSPM